MNVKEWADRHKEYVFLDALQTLESEVREYGNREVILVNTGFCRGYLRSLFFHERITTAEFFRFSREIDALVYPGVTHEFRT